MAIYANVPTASQVAVIHRTTMKVVTTWRVDEANANFPIALDEANHRLFIGCRRPAKALVYDTQKGALLGSTDIVGDTDDLFSTRSRGDCTSPAAKASSTRSTRRTRLT